MIGLSAFSCHLCFVNSLNTIILLLPSPPRVVLGSGRAEDVWFRAEQPESQLELGGTNWLVAGLQQVGCRGKRFGLMEKGQVRPRVGLSRLL